MTTSLIVLLVLIVIKLALNIVMLAWAHDWDRKLDQAAARYQARGQS